MIVRAPRKASNFYVLDKSISEDSRLSWGARGLLVFLLGKPDNWQVSPAALVNETAGTDKPAGRDAVYSLLAELRTTGYLLRSQSRNPDGSMGPVHYLVAEAPLPEKPDAAPLPGQPYPANPTQTRTEKKQGLKEEGEREREKVVMVEGDSGWGIVVPLTIREQYAKAYPGVDVAEQVAKAEAWINANLSRRPKSQVGRFLNGWMARAHRDLKAQPLRVVQGGKATKHERREQMSNWLFGQDAPHTTGGNDVIDVVATQVR